MKEKLKKTYILFFTYIFRIFPVKKNKIMFWNFFGKGYGCNSKYICEYIIKNKEQYELIWVVNNYNYEFPKEIRKVKKYSFKYFYHLATSKIFIDNQHKNNSFRKRKTQYLIKTWHAMLGLKKIGLDNPSKDDKYLDMLKKNNKITDLMISNSDYISEKFRRVFDYKGEIFNSGFPRTDILIQKNLEEIKKIKNKIQIKDSNKILLYAPTFREGLTLDYYDIDLENVLKKLNAITEEKWIILIKLHPHLGTIKLNYNSPNIINISGYDDIQELLLISDILVTDYSNIMFEFGLMNKPVFLYASDYELYKKQRDYYFDYNKLPFPVAFDNKQLLENIEKFNLDCYKKILEKFYKSIDYKEDGRATERLVKKISEMIEN